jgi:ATP-dependent DNA helicase RecG
MIQGMSIIDVSQTIALLRDTGSDTHRIEAKAGKTAMPDTIDETLSAFANMPEGGLIILGLQENGGSFDPVGVWDAKEAQDGLAAKARNRIVPPMQLGAVDVVEFEDVQLVTAVVPPQASDHRPFRVGRNGPAYIRSGDGDYELSGQEILLLMGQRGQPTHELAVMEAADVDRDLDPDLIQQYLAEETRNSPRLQAMSREEQLIRTNVVDSASGRPTIAAVYALGVHPQQFLPTLTVKTHAVPPEGAADRTRMINPREFNGPVPDLLEQALAWVMDNSVSRVDFEEGRGRNVPEFPPVAIREVLANALVHRDLSVPARSMFVQAVKIPGGLVVTNPGGLWGVTESQLGTTSPRTRNPVLYRMCSAITTTAGHRVIEARATGIPEIRRALAEADLPGPRFTDRVISFHAKLSNASLLSKEDREWLLGLPGGSSLTVAQRHALVAMRNDETVTNRSYRAEFPMDSVDARRELQQLVSFGLAVAEGGRGGAVYRLASSVGQGALPGETVKLPTHRPAAMHASSDSRPPRLSGVEKTRRVIDILQASSRPLSRVEIRQGSGLTAGQLNPTLTELREQGVVEFTEPAQSRHQRYRLVR